MLTSRLSRFGRFLGLASLAALPLAGCDSNKDDQKTPLDCTLNVSNAAQTVQMRYTYSVSKPTTGTVTTVSYRSAAPTASTTGIATVQNPVLPWSVTVTLDRNVAPLLTALGSVTNGKISAKIDGVSSESTSQVTVSNDRECVQY